MQLVAASYTDHNGHLDLGRTRVEVDGPVGCALVCLRSEDP
jgi:hypothetical protein